MIGKITKGKSFSTIVTYILDSKKDAELIDSEGVLTSNHQDMIASFNMQASLNPRLGLKVGHISLNWHKKDLPILTNELMKKIAREYLQEMGIVNTQYIIGRHNDKEHPHIHICYNRIDNDGKTISDKNERIRNAKITNALTIKYGLYYSSGKEQVKTHRLREPHKTQHEIYDAVKVAIKECNSWETLKSQLENQGIEVTFKYRGQTADIQGVSFTKNGYTFSGSKVDKSLSFSKIDKVLESNNLTELIILENKQQYVEQPSSFTPYGHYTNYDDEDVAPNQKKKNKRKSNNRGISL